MIVDAKTSKQLPTLADPLTPPMPASPGERLHWGRLYGLSDALAIAAAVREFNGLVLILADDVQAAGRLEQALHFFLDREGIPLLSLPDWETLPYDVFSPLPELVSERLLTLHRMPALRRVHPRRPCNKVTA